jgi:hypothetical protein
MTPGGTTGIHFDAPKEPVWKGCIEIWRVNKEHSCRLDGLSTDNAEADQVIRERLNKTLGEIVDELDRL